MANFVISLDKCPEKLAKFKKTNPFLKNLRVFPAFDGAKLNIDVLIADKTITKGLAYTEGALGCAYSHIRLWKYAAEELEYTTIIEDDAVLNKDFEKKSRETILSLPKDWDLIVWGWNFDCPMQFVLLDNISPAFCSFKQSDIDENISHFQDLNLKILPFRLQFCFGTPCYSVSPKGAKKLLASLLPLRNFTLQLGDYMSPNKGIDIALVSQYNNLLSYVSVPPLALTANKAQDSTTR